jgi:hypothetical protein
MLLGIYFSFLNIEWDMLIASNTRESMWKNFYSLTVKNIYAKYLELCAKRIS